MFSLYEFDYPLTAKDYATLAAQDREYQRRTFSAKAKRFDDSSFSQDVAAHSPKGIDDSSPRRMSYRVR